MRAKSFFLILVISLLSINFVGADVGVGASPAKFLLQMPGGQSQTQELLIFNPGSSPIEVSISVDGDIAAFTKITPEKAIIQPEPVPHEKPIKNGRRFVVTFSPPASREKKVYTGSISASGGPTAGQFGGSVAVASLVELTVTPPASFLDYITKWHVAAALLVLILIVLLLTLKKAGLKVSFEKKKEKGL